MLGLKEKIKKDLQEAVKSKQEAVVLTLRGLLASLLDEEKKKRFISSQQGEQDLERVSLEENEIIKVISSEAKKRREAMSEYEKGGREELAEKEKRELEILQKYLPEQLSDEELDQIVEEAVKKTGASGMRDMGKVMSEVMGKVEGRAEGGTVSEKVRAKLSG